MQVPNAAHTSQPWRIHEIVEGFRLQDVWALPTPGGPDDFPRLVALMTSLDPLHSPSRVVRTLFAVRLKLGRLLRLDDPGPSDTPGGPTLRDRLPRDLREGPTGPAFESVPFTPLYRTDDEFAAEVANRTVHGVLHLSWVPGEAGDRYHGRMAVYVKPNGRLGAAYMATIGPFRRVLYPRLMQAIGRAWQAAA